MNPQPGSGWATVLAVLMLSGLSPMCLGATGDRPAVALDLEERGGQIAHGSPDSTSKGTIRGAAWITGRFGAALAFDGIADHVDVGHPPRLSSLTALTVAAWVAACSQGEYAKLVTKGKASNCSFFLSQGPASHKTYFGVRARDGSTASAICNRYLPLCEWVHLAGVWDGTAVRLYWNGKEVASTPCPGPLVVNREPLRISGYSGSRECFTGAIGSVRIYTRALSSDEVRTVCDREKARYGDKAPLRIKPVFEAPRRPERGTLVDIGSRVELFTDDWLIAEMKGVAIRLHRPVRRKTALRFDSPWDGAFAVFGTVVRDGDLYRMWYRGQATLRAPPVTCYAESNDGIHWRKPNLQLTEYADGSRPDLAPTRHNNIVWRGVYSYNFTPFLDRNPNCKPEQRYKAVANIVPWMTQARWLKTEARQALAADNATCLFSSPDGIHWTMLASKVMPGFDSQTPTFWDSIRGEYRMYCSHGHIRTMVSADLLRWTGAVSVLYDDAFRERRYYSCAVMPYVRAPHLFIGLAARVGEGHPFLDKSSPFAAMGGKVAKIGAHDIVLMTSRNGLHFRRHMDAFLRPGRDIHNWTGHSQFAMIGVPPTGPVLSDATPTELSLYVGQHYSLPSAHVARFTIRTDGFSSVNAPYTGGEFRTRPIIFEGSELLLNASTSATGSVRVEIQDTSGRPLDGYTLDECPDIYGDEVSRRVEWGNGAGLSQLAGRPVRLRFVLKDADLFSIRFR